MQLQTEPQDVAAALRTRKATIADLSFVARMAYEASLPPLNHCFWDDLLPGTETDGLTFITAMLRVGASNWGNVEDFVILEEQGYPVAAAAGYCPDAVDYRPLKLAALPALAQDLGWSPETLHLFRDRYEQFWQFDLQPLCLQPQATWIIENVAVMPTARGRGLGKVLIQALLAEGKARHHSHAGIMIINGNEAAQRTYESVGFKLYQAFYADYFSDEFVGIIKFRCRLEQS
jgi:GNAT superfamily N-acetyltransferase